MSARDVLSEIIQKTAWEVWNRPDERADAILTALSAAGYVIERDWQPLATAPRDGTPILAWGKHPSLKSDEFEARQTYWSFFGEGSIAHSDFRAGKGPSGNWQWYEPIHNWVCDWRPTHWRPLPVPPEATP